MNIVYGCDDNFAPVLYVSVATLIKCNADSKLKIYIIDDHISENNKKEINGLAIGNNKIFETMDYYGAIIGHYLDDVLIRYASKNLVSCKEFKLRKVNLEVGCCPKYIDKK